MKTFKLKGIDYYLCCFNIKEAVSIFWINKIGVREENIELTDIEPNRDAIGIVFKNLSDYLNYTTEL